MKNLMGVAGGDRNRFHQDIANTLADLAAFLKPRWWCSTRCAS